jgi:hypothetical protein
LVKRSQKQLYTKKGSDQTILIDDYIKNINEFKAKGGIGIHHTSAQNTIFQLKKLGL